MGVDQEKMKIGSTGQKVIDPPSRQSHIADMKIIIYFFLLGLFFSVSYSQSVPDSIYEREAIEKLTSLLNLKPSDISFRDDYTDKDSFRLSAIARLMKNPYEMIGYAEQFGDFCRGGRIESILRFAFENLETENQTGESRELNIPVESSPEAGINLFYSTIEFNRLLMKVDSYLYDIIPQSSDSALSLLNIEERNFLIDEFREILLEDTADEHRSVEELDSIQQVEEAYSERFAEFGDKIRKDFIILAGLRAASGISDEIELLVDKIESGNLTIGEILSDTAVMPDRIGIAEYLGKNERWRIAGTENDYHDGDYDFIIDFGGDDRYELSYDPEKPHGAIIIDMSGNDIYNAKSEYVIGSGCLSVGLLFDLKGDDVYNGGNFSCGSGYFGLGLLYDGGGSDKYYGDSHTQGAATFGIGVLIDAGGADIYSGALYAQGLGLTEGFGLIADYAGSDFYIAGSKYKESIGLAGKNVRYLSQSQGFGYGIRPYTSGGIGAIVDFQGNDSYVSDIYGQGASFWWAFGMIHDYDGHDRYVSHQYGQGSGTHMSVGILMDENGDDFYRGKGLMQGCGHDYACGLILDRNGNDIYQAHDLSQAGGQANGIGILVDNRGDDAYYVLRKHNTQGYGNPRRDFGSIGLFLDLAGTDLYHGNGEDNTYWKTDSRWGGGMDIEFIRPDTSGQGEN